jgi:hypothetical protein
MRTIVCAAVAALSSVAAAEPALKLIDARKVWDRGRHNAFTDLIRFHGAFLCAFREGETHVNGAGEIRVLRSADGDQWEPLALIKSPDVDLRDPKLSVMPDGRLMLLGGAADPATRNPLKDHYSFVCFSKDGREWTSPRRVAQSWEWLWRATWKDKTAYGVAYRFGPPVAGVKERYTALLCRSTDGADWTRLVEFAPENATEAALAFDGDRMLCLLRRDGRPNTAQLGAAAPPYTEWAWKDLGAYFGGPQLIRDADGTWWACGRLTTSGKPQTAVCRLEVAAGKLIPAVTLPSGGDTSYPGMVWHDGKLWISYYSSHEGKSSIYLARLGR